MERLIHIKSLLILDASLWKMNVLNEWVTRKIHEAEKSLNSAEDKLEMINILKEEGHGLQSLGEDVL